MSVCSRCGGSGEEPNDKAIGEAMRQRRLRVGMTLRGMADALKLSPSYLSDLEVGRRQWGTLNVRRYEDALRVKETVAI